VFFLCAKLDFIEGYTVGTKKNWNRKKMTFLVVVALICFIWDKNKKV